jgi:hypothetical protein
MESNHPKKALQTFPWPLGFRAIKNTQCVLLPVIISQKQTAARGHSTLKMSCPNLGWGVERTIPSWGK